jgi:hypothetical protein
LHGHSPNFHIHVSVSDLNYSHLLICLFCCRKYVDRSWEYKNRSQRHMNVEIWTEAAQFPEKEYINGILVAVQASLSYSREDEEAEEEEGTGHPGLHRLTSLRPLVLTQQNIISLFNVEGSNQKYSSTLPPGVNLTYELLYYFTTLLFNLKMQQKDQIEERSLSVLCFSTPPPPHEEQWVSDEFVVARDIYCINRQATRHDCLPSLLGDRD